MTWYADEYPNRKYRIIFDHYHTVQLGFYAANFEVGGAYCFWVICLSIHLSHFSCEQDILITVNYQNCCIMYFYMNIMQESFSINGFTV